MVFTRCHYCQRSSWLLVAFVVLALFSSLFCVKSAQAAAIHQDLQVHLDPFSGNLHITASIDLKNAPAESHYFYLNPQFHIRSTNVPVELAIDKNQDLHRYAYDASALKGHFLRIEYAGQISPDLPGTVNRPRSFADSNGIISQKGVYLKKKL